MDWLSLKFSASPNPDRIPSQTKILIAIPKKIMRLATRRNRIRRLIREAVRHDARFKDASKLCVLRVARDPGTIGLADVIREMEKK